MNFPNWIKEFSIENRLRLFETIVNLSKTKLIQIKFLKSVFEKTLADTLSPSPIETINLAQDLSQLDISFREDFIIKIIIRCLEIDECPEWREKLSRYFVEKYLEKFSKNQTNELISQCHEHNWWKFAQQTLEKIDCSDWRFNSVFAEWAKFLIVNKFEYSTVWNFLKNVFKTKLTADQRNLETALRDFIKLVIQNGIDVMNLEKLFEEFSEFCDSKALITVLSYVIKGRQWASFKRCFTVIKKAGKLDTKVYRFIISALCELGQSTMMVKYFG